MGGGGKEMTEMARRKKERGREMGGKGGGVCLLLSC